MCGRFFLKRINSKLNISNLIYIPQFGNISTQGGGVSLQMFFLVFLTSSLYSFVCFIVKNKNYTRQNPQVK